MNDTQNLNPDNLPTVPYGEDFPEIRRSIQAICKDFPGSTGATRNPRRSMPRNSPRR